MIVIAVRSSLLALAAIASVALVACSSGAVPTPSASPRPAGSQVVVVTPEDAVARVVAVRPDLAGIGPFDRDRIGGCCWYRLTARDGGYDVEFRVGWGDCPAGCIDEHTWTYRVGAGGSVELIGESGDAIPAGGIPAG